MQVDGWKYERMNDKGNALVLNDMSCDWRALNYIPALWSCAKFFFLAMFLNLVLYIWQNGKLGDSCVSVTKSRLYDSRVRNHIIVHLGLNVSSSAHNIVFFAKF